MNIDLSLRCQHQLKLNPDIQQSLHFLQLSADQLQEEVLQLIRHNPFIYIQQNNHHLSLEDIPSIVQEETHSLQDTLREQIRFLSLSDTDKDYLRILILGINDAGYWSYDETETRHVFQELGLTDAQGAYYLACLQQLEPLGIGTRNLRERLLYHIQHRYAEHPLAETAQDILKTLPTEGTQKEWMQHIQHSDPDTVHWLKQLIAAIPASSAEHKTRYIQPDLRVQKDKDQWIVMPYDEPNYRFSLAIDLPPEAIHAEALKQEWITAKNILRHIERRQSTLLLVATTIVNAQQDFFEHGRTAIRPLSMKQIADLLPLHESTISRVVHDKYLWTTQGILPLKSLFSHCVNTESGICSSMAVQAILKEYIDQEDKDRPLSDTALVQYMKTRGIQVARRTIAKYRTALAIPPAHLRRHSLVKY